MELQEIYRLAVRLGMEADPRGQEELGRLLEKRRREYDELKAEEKKHYDQEHLTNPYSDTRILYGEPGREVRTVLSGIDVETAEVLLADRLRQGGRDIDLIITHHPEGKALAALHDVMHLQEDVLANLGVPINVAEDILAGRISEVERGLAPLNHNRAVDAARLLDIPIMSCHTPADNMVTKYLEELVKLQEPRTVGDVVDLLLQVPEYQRARETNAGPKVILGDKKRRAGKVFIDMTGGTGGSEDAYAPLVTAGVGTIVAMHMSDKHRKEAEKNHLNVIIAGHIASDSLGMNLFLDELERRGLTVLTFSGLTRVRRLEESAAP